MYSGHICKYRTSNESYSQQHGSNDIEYSQYNSEDYKDPIFMKRETGTFPNTSNPSIWGPSLWFSLHNGAMHYPLEASNHRRKRMKDFILGIPAILPCQGCIPHAIAYIESVKPKLDDIVSGRDKLFKFFVDFHNNVNTRYGKKLFTYDEAYDMYAKGVNLTKMTAK